MCASDEPAGQEVIVVIDDDYAMRLSCRQILAKSGFQVETFEDGTLGLEGVARLKPALAVVDLKMPGLSGIEVVGRIREIDPNTVIVVITGYATIGTAVDAMKAGAYDFLPKPFKPDELRMIVGRALERRRLLLNARTAEVERELLKRRFVTFVSHQLKTPLVAIHQYLDVLKRLGDTEEAHAKSAEWLDRCLVRTEEMTQIISDWLTLANLEGDALSRQHVKVDLGEIVAKVLKMYEGLASQEGVTLSTTVPEAGCYVIGDRNCLAVLLDNLVVNAIKYNKKGGRVDVSWEPLDQEVIISVSDTGIGISERDRDRLFDEFFRAKGETGKETTGTGLGLPICRRIVSEHGGSIEVESEPQMGSTFRVRLPAWRGIDGLEESGGPGE